MEILPQLLVNALIQGSIYALASAGLSLTYGLMRVLNFAHGHFMMVGAYLFYLLTVEWSWLAGQNLWASLALAGAATVLFVVVFAMVTLRVFVAPFSRFSSLLPFVTTLSLATILESAVAMIFGVNVKTLSRGMEINSIELSLGHPEIQVFITPVQLIIIASALVLLVLLALLVHTTPFGRKVRALAEHREAAEGLAINSTLCNYLVFIVGALFAAYAGIMVGYETNLQPTMGGVYTIKAFAAMVLGGLGNIWGTIAGSFILGLVENLSVGLLDIPAGYKDAFAFIIILLVLLFKPKGLFNTRSREA